MASGLHAGLWLLACVHIALALHTDPAAEDAEERLVVAGALVRECVCTYTVIYRGRCTFAHTCNTSGRGGGLLPWPAAPAAAGNGTHQPAMLTLAPHSSRVSVLLIKFQRSFTRTLSTEAALCEEREERLSPC
jgi:hypothetical protein